MFETFTFKMVVTIGFHTFFVVSYANLGIGETN